jgi:ribonuclease Z
LEQIIFLGTASAISNKNQENSHLFIESGDIKILVDCPGNPISRLIKANVDPLEVTDLVITHFHADHVSGLPLLLMDLWLMGRKTPLNIYGLEFTLDHAEALMELFDWKKWPDFFKVNFHNVKEIENVTIINNEWLTVTTSPGKHLVPSIGLKFEFPVSKKVVVYSSDTEPNQMISNLAKNSDILIHESAGSAFGHTSPEYCGKIAHQENVRKLFLIHYSNNLSEEQLVSQARKHFDKDVVVAKDLMVIELN